MKLLQRAFLKSLPVMAGYIVLGIGFGVLLKVNGYGLGWALLMSIFIFAGSMQFVGITLMTSGASLVTVALTTLLVNARHLFYGISMVDKYKGAGMKKPYLIHALTDETYSLVCTDDMGEEGNSHTYYFLVSLMDQCYWVIGSIIGVILGTVLSFNSAGIEFSMTALFVTVFVEQWLTSKEHRPALVGLGATLICLLVFGKDIFLIPSMIAITILLFAMKRSLKKRETQILESEKGKREEA